jgi:dipeptidase E
MGKIVAIGGGVLREGETDTIDKFLLELSGKDNPSVLFIPTANYDSPEYTESFTEAFGALGCSIEVLNLLGRNPSADELTSKILSPDIIYVGGGNTLKMMRRWRRLGVDTLIREAWESDVVLSGVSAGAICWFDWGHSDSMAFYDEDDWNYVRVAGMGLIKGLACPHYDSDIKGVARRADFHKMMLKHSNSGIAIDNRCALVVVGEKYRVISATDTAGAYKLTKRGGSVVEEPIASSEDWEPVENLY